MSEKQKQRKLKKRVERIKLKKLANVRKKAPLDCSYRHKYDSPNISFRQHNQLVLQGVQQGKTAHESK